MTPRTLIIPAAGAGSRLGAAIPKALVPVAGVPMLQRILSLYAPYVASVVVVASPGGREAIASCVGTRASVVVQERATGMLDAVLLARGAVPPGAPVWITWCDQVAVEPSTVRRLSQLDSGAAMVFPTVRQSPPYIHFERDAGGRIVAVRQRREGDAMPQHGESDMGLFALSSEAFHVLLPAFAGDPAIGAGTGERNFLPFIPWLAARRMVLTYPSAHVMESIGVNTPAELARIEAHLKDRGRA